MGPVQLCRETWICYKLKKEEGISGEGGVGSVMMQNVCVEGVFYVHRLSVDGGSVARICGACYVVWHAGDYVCLLLLASAVSDAVIRALYFALLSIL